MVLEKRISVVSGGLSMDPQTGILIFPAFQLEHISFGIHSVTQPKIIIFKSLSNVFNIAFIL